MQDTTKFVHLTDLHFSSAGTNEPTLLSDTERAIRNSFAAIDRMAVPPAFIAISGDLTDRGNLQDYRVLKTLMAELAGTVPLIYALGNHDRRDNFYAVFGGNETGEALAPYDHDRVMENLHIITMDTSIPGRIGGGLSETQIAWLGKRLQSQPDLRKLIVIHHSPLFDLNRENAWDRLDARSTEALRQAIAGFPVVGILCGHVHMEEVTHWHGVPVIVGVGHHAATDPLAPQGEIRLVEATGLSLCTLRPFGLSVTFVPHPQDRRVLRSIATDPIMAHDAAARAAQAAG